MVDRLLANGIAELNFFKELAPRQLWEDSDDAFTGLWSRRPGFELALRRVAEAEPGVTLCCPASAAGLLYDGSASRVPEVAGVRLEDGAELVGDVVLDCGGRRTPVVRWLAADHGVELPEDVQDCKAAYYTRHYRQAPSSELSQLWLVGAAVPLERLTAVPFTGDNGAFGIGLFADPDDKELRVLRHDWAFEAVVESIPSLAPWIAPDNAEPINSTSSMTGHQNVRRHFVVDGAPLVHGLLPVGDSLCTTNPQSAGAHRWPSPSRSRRSTPLMPMPGTGTATRWLSRTTTPSARRPTACTASRQRWIGSASTSGTGPTSPPTMRQRWNGSGSCEASVPARRTIPCWVARCFGA